MGGQNKNAQAQQALGNQAASTSQGTANTYGGEQTGLFNTLFGAGGKGGGTLSSMMNPASLNINAPTGPYALQYQQAKAQGAQDTDFAKQAIMRDAGNAGFGAGAPSGYTGYLKSQADLQNAGNTGQLFSQFAGKSYQDALNNFWKANQMAGTAMGQAGQEQNTAQGQTNQTYANLYGSTPKQTTMGAIGNSLIGAAGTAGSAAITCVCEGTRIEMADGRELPVELVKVGDKVRAQGHGQNEVLEIQIHENQPCLQIETQMGGSFMASESHTVARPHGGYVKLKDAYMQTVSAAKMSAYVTAVRPAGDRTVYRLVLNGNHTYLSSGIWSLE